MESEKCILARKKHIFSCLVVLSFNIYEIIRAKKFTKQTVRRVLIHFFTRFSVWFSQTPRKFSCDKDKKEKHVLIKLTWLLFITFYDYVLQVESLLYRKSVHVRDEFPQNDVTRVARLINEFARHYLYRKFICFDTMIKHNSRNRY